MHLICVFSILLAIISIKISYSQPVSEFNSSKYKLARSLHKENLPSSDISKCILFLKMFRKFQIKCIFNCSDVRRRDQNNFQSRKT